MQEWIRQIIIYVILVTVLRGLIMKPQYEQYFRFFSGIVLILLVVSPVLRVLHQDTAWHDTVEQYLFQMDVNDIQEQLAVTEGRRQEVIMQQYTEQLEEQIKKQAGQHALPADEVTVKADAKGVIHKIELHLKTEETSKVGGERTIAASRYWAPQDPCDRGGRHCTVGALSAGDRWFSKEDRKAGKLIGCDIRGGIRADCVRCYGAI